MVKSSSPTLNRQVRELYRPVGVLHPPICNAWVVRVAEDHHRPHRLAVRTPDFHSGDHGFESRWGHMQITKKTYPRDNHVNAIVAQAEAQRAQRRQPWDEPVFISGSGLLNLNAGDWLFLNLNHIYAEKTSE